MALYLCHKDDSVSVEQVLRYWDHLRSVPVATEEEKQQRRMDLEHVLHVFIRAGDWRQCSSLLDDANCTARHVSLYLRGLARTRDLRRMVSVYLDHGSLVYSGDASSAVQEKHFIVNLLLDVAKLTRDSTLGEVVIGDVLRHATVGSRDFSFPLTSAIYARMARLSIAHGLTSCVYRLYVLGDPRSREMPKVLRSMERYMASVDSTDPEILRMKEEVSRLHLSNPLDGEAAGETRSEQEKTSGLVFDEDEFIEEDVLQIIHSRGNIQVENEQHTDEGIKIEGILHLSFLYLRGDDTEPYGSWQGIMPFSYLIEYPDLPAGAADSLSFYVEQLAVTLAGSEAVEIKAVLAFDVFLRKRIPTEMITEVRTEPFPAENLENRPGIVGHIVQNGEDLWSLAKKYLTTVDGIMEINGMDSENIRQGDKLLIFKENMSIL